MAVTGMAYKGLRGARYRFMMEHMPDRVRELEASGRMDAYLDGVQARYLRRADDLMPGCMRACGATPELQRTDYGEYYTRLEQAERMARETAYREVVEES